MNTYVPRYYKILFILVKVMFMLNDKKLLNFNFTVVFILLLFVNINELKF